MSVDSRNVPRPPGLHWTLVLLLGILTVGIFLDVWMIVQAVWARKLDKANKGLVLYVSGIALSFVVWFLGKANVDVRVQVAVRVATAVLMVVASFKVRDALGEYISDVDRRPTYLSGVLTIFLGPIYLQYHMDKVRGHLRHLPEASAA